MTIVSVVDEGLGNSAYVVDLGDGGALVVDPQRDPRRYLDEIARRGLAARFVLETHLHADFVSGASELMHSGARLLAPAGSELSADHRPLRDTQELDLGGLTLQVIATPGHTPEHLAYLLLDGSKPLGVFSGGTLIAAGVARTDLLSPELTEPLAREAYRSIRDRLFALPDELEVFPTHGAGSFCATTPGGERTTTIGRERTTNPLLADDPDEDTFVARLVAGYGSFPPYFLALRDVNRAGPEVYGAHGPPVPRLSPQKVAAAREAGSEVVDARSTAAFAAGHVPGALAIPWRAQFATWLGWLVGRDRDVVFITDGSVDHADLAWAAATVGVDRIVGVLDGGMQAWTGQGRPVARIPLLQPEQAVGRRVVDIRQRAEHVAEHVADSDHVELGFLALAPEQVADGPVLVHCGHGERAMSAASLLQRAGHTDVAVLDGGPAVLSSVGYRLSGAE